MPLHGKLGVPIRAQLGCQDQLHGQSVIGTPLALTLATWRALRHRGYHHLGSPLYLS